MYKRLEWLEKRDVHLQSICEALEFTSEEIDQARQNFKWYMITPTGVMRVHLDLTVHGSVTEGFEKLSLLHFSFSIPENPSHFIYLNTSFLERLADILTF